MRLGLGVAAISLLLSVSCTPVLTPAANLLPAAGPVEGGSSGCLRPPPAAPPTRLIVDGVERQLLARVPASYQNDEPTSLVIAFHGRTNTNRQVRRYFDLDDWLPEAIILYPAGLSGASGFTWADPHDPPEELRDFAFVDALLATYMERYCIDPERIFVVGHSLGAYFANSLACRRPGAIRAVASVAGGVQGGECEGPVAAMLVHHPEDGLVPIEEGRRALGAFLGRRAEPAQGVPTEGPLARLGCTSFDDHGEPVLWCRHGDATSGDGSYYPHTWPDAAPEAIATFFTGLR